MAIDFRASRAVQEQFRETMSGFARAIEREEKIERRRVATDIDLMFQIPDGAKEVSND